ARRVVQVQPRVAGAEPPPRAQAARELDLVTRRLGVRARVIGAAGGRIGAGVLGEVPLARTEQRHRGIEGAIAPLALEAEFGVAAGHRADQPVVDIGLALLAEDLAVAGVERVVPGQVPYRARVRQGVLLAAVDRFAVASTACFHPGVVGAGDQFQALGRVPAHRRVHALAGVVEGRTIGERVERRLGVAAVELLQRADRGPDVRAVPGQLVIVAPGPVAA